MPHALLVHWFCRFYSVLLYAYPCEFRARYGGEMQRAFRDRCRDLAPRGPLRLLRFALATVGDWAASAIWERMDSMTIREHCRKAAQGVAQHARAVWAAGRGQRPRGFVAEWTMSAVVFLFASTTLVQAYVVPTGSMEGTLRVGDHMFVDRVAFSPPGSLSRHLLPYRDVQRGDIVAFLYPEDIRQTYVKRVIGLPGDRIRLVDKQVVRNGRRLIEPYTQHIDPLLEAYRDEFPTAPGAYTTPRGREMFRDHVVDGEVVVPPDSLFVMGDNRDNSADSRFWGFVPRDSVVGKPLLVYWSYDASTSELVSWSLSHLMDVAEHFFTKTRWERTLHIPRSEQAQEAP